MNPRHRYALVLLVVGVLLAMGGCTVEGSTPPRTAGADSSLAPINPQITAVMLRRISYERDETPEAFPLERQQVPVDGRLSVTEAVSRWGDLAGECLLLPEDPQYRGRLGYRAEWQSEFHAEQDVEYWYGASYYLPEDWNQGENDAFDDRIIFQFHEGTDGPPAFSLHLDDERDRFVVRRRASEDDDFDYLWSGRFQEERWYDFAFQALWSREDDGFFRVYVNNELVHDYRGPTLVDGRTVYTKWGVYGQPTHLFFDEVRVVEGEDALGLANPWRLPWHRGSDRS